jgi:hypothetical protein
MTAVLLLALMLAQQTAPPEKCAISGTVVDSITGMPLGKADIVAAKVGAESSGLSTQSDAKGNFSMENLDPGQYRVFTTRNGYLDAYYGAKRASRTGSTLSLTPGQKIEDLRIGLVPFGVIAGVVGDTDGEPIMTENVNIYRLVQGPGGTRMIQAGNKQTDDLGQFRFVNLHPGKYYVSAVFQGWSNVAVNAKKWNDRPEVRVTTFYPGTTDPAVAQTVEVGVGARVTGVDFTIVRSRLYKIGVHVDTAPGFRGSTRLMYSVDGLYPAGPPYNANSNGDLEISGVPAGSYRLQVFAHEAENMFCSVSVPVVVERADLEGLRVAVGACPTAEGRVTVEGDAKGDAKPELAGAIVDFEHGDRNAQLRADGSFATGLSPGPGNIDLSRITKEKSLYVKSIRSGNQDVLRNGFVANASERVELEVVLASDGGKVDGTVSDKDDKPVAGATVVLIPNDPALRARLDYGRDATTDQAGHFEMKNIAPGDYKLFAWDDVEEGSWFDPDFLKDFEAKGQPVIVKVSDSQTVKLAVLPLP